MSDRESQSIGTIIAEIARPMILAMVMVFLFSPIGMPWMFLSILAVVALPPIARISHP